MRVTDPSSNRNEQIANFAGLLTNAPAKRKVFAAVYHGKKRTRTVSDIATATRYSGKRVTEIAKKLADEGLFDQGRELYEGRRLTVYKKIPFLVANKTRILALAKDKTKLSSFPTKSNPTSTTVTKISIRVPFKPNITFIHPADVDQFSKIKKIRGGHHDLKPRRLSETRLKAGLVNLLTAERVQKDWGGEINDIFTCKLRINGVQRRAAFALKGPAVSGTLVPGKMGKNGDQVQRLFSSPADVFFVQYEGVIHESVITLMEQLARARAIVDGERVYYGIIDADDTYRLRVAYPKAFKTP